jgi:phosphoesterase RecJ-like protein
VEQPRVPPGLLAFLGRYARFLVLGHIEPDGDSVAAQLVLASLLRRQGKEALLYSPGPFDRPEIAPFADHFLSALPSAGRLGKNAAAVVLDCSTADRLGNFAGLVSRLPTLVIDHHAAGEEFGSLRWIVPEAPAVAYLVQLLMESMDMRPTQEEAELLLFGLARDTGFFRHLGEGSAPVFDAVGRLVAAGASPQRVYRLMHSGWEPAKIRLLALSLQRAEAVLGGRALITWQTLQDQAEAVAGSAQRGAATRGGRDADVAAQAAARSPEGRMAAATRGGRDADVAAQPRMAAATRGSDETYRLLQAVSGVEVVAFLQEEPGGRCSVGLRSSQVVDVGRLARSLGGGGHVRAAGYTRRGSLTEVRAELLAALGPLLG